MKGADAETLALAHLKKHGLILIQRNFRARGGELDLIMRHGQNLVIAEVRKRSNPRFGDGLASVDRRKRHRILRATEQLLAQNPQWSDWPLRFDIVALNAENQIQWLRAAFDADDCG
ncbi:MAG: YraN family protein [Panacagrimonas sp.]